MAAAVLGASGDDGQGAGGVEDCVWSEGEEGEGVEWRVE